MSALEWILSILLFIVSLGILIIIHELGHFSMAKLFKVYCQEFSIGFGPAIIHKKKEGHETYFSLRAVPLGGYVSMYGEDETADDPNNVIPKERSIEGIRKWKKAIILFAGVFLNAILAFVLIAISNLAFPRILTTRYASVTPGSQAAAVVSENDKMCSYPFDVYTGDTYVDYSYTTSDKVIHQGQFFVIDNNVNIEGKKYVLTYSPTGTKNYTKFTDGFKLYPGIAGENIGYKDDQGKFVVVNSVLASAYERDDKNGYSIHWLSTGDKSTLYPDFTSATYTPFENSQFTTNLKFLHYNKELNAFDSAYTFAANVKAIEKNGKYYWEDIGLSFQTIEDKSFTFGQRMKKTCTDFGDASVAVFKGLGILFTGGIKNMSGIVGIFETSATLVGSYTFATYFYFWGMISVNLAIFNLLPFPGLDGWQLLVTAIEGATRKKIPAKVKSIVSAIGLALLFALMIAIVVLDIIKLV